MQGHKDAFYDFHSPFVRRSLNKKKGSFSCLKLAVSATWRIFLELFSLDFLLLSRAIKIGERRRDEIKIKGPVGWGGNRERRQFELPSLFWGEISGWQKSLKVFDRLMDEASGWDDGQVFASFGNFSGGLRRKANQGDEDGRDLNTGWRMLMINSVRGPTISPQKDAWKSNFLPNTAWSHLF